jgi:hypothetical protein
VTGGVLVPFDSSPEGMETLIENYLGRDEVNVSELSLFQIGIF